MRAATIGLTRIEVPVEVGGLGLGFRAKAEACAIIAAADFGLAMSLVNTHNVAKRIATTAPPDVAAKLLPELLSGRVSACTALTEPAPARRRGDALYGAQNAGRLATGRRKDVDRQCAACRLSIVYAQCDQPARHPALPPFWSI